MIKGIIVFLCLSVCFSLKAQMLENEFFRIQVSDSYDFKKINGSHEDLADIEIYRINTPKAVFMTQLMANKLNYDIAKIDEENYEKFLGDFGSINIIGHRVLKIDDKKSFYEVEFMFKDERSIKCFGYFIAVEDILYRIIFMYPEKLFDKGLYDSGLSMIHKVEFKRSKWPI